VIGLDSLFLGQVGSVDNDIHDHIHGLEWVVNIFYQYDVDFRV